MNYLQHRLAAVDVEMSAAALDRLLGKNLGTTGPCQFCVYSIVFNKKSVLDELEVLCLSTQARTTDSASTIWRSSCTRTTVTAWRARCGYRIVNMGGYASSPKTPIVHDVY